MKFSAVKHIQHRLSAVASVAALVLSINALVARVLFYGDQVFPAIVHPTVLPTFLIGVVVGLTGLSEKEIARLCQVMVLLIVGCASALTARGGDLTGAVFYGLGLLVAGEYGYLGSRRVLKLFVAIIPFVILYGYGLFIHTHSLVLATLQTFLGGGLVAYMFYTIAAARLQELANRQAELEAMVKERTETLRSEVDRRKLAEGDLRVTAKRSTELAADREVLLQELHHRSKNDLQLVSSIMSLKAAKGGDPSLKALFRPIQNRVRAIALIHEQLDGTDRYDQVSITGYLKALLSHVQLSHSEFRVRIVPDIPEDAIINLEAAEHLGLLLNELILISYTHSFDGLSSGRIDVTVAMGEAVVVTITDNGKLLPRSVDPSSPDDADLGIAAGLLGSLSGTIQLQREPQTCWTLTMPGDVFAPGE